MFQSIAFGGGGVRGGMLVGAISALERTQGLVFPKGVYGTSIGAVLATAVAFQMNAQQIKDMFENKFDLPLPSIRISNVTDVPTKKGLFSMDALEQMLVQAFQSQGIDIRDKTIGDAAQPLRIVASNMTTRRITILQGSVPLLTALKCSCCLPFVFHPQVLYGHVYLDGGVLLDSLVPVVPPDTLVFHISSTGDPMYPQQLGTMSLSSFVHAVYRGFRSASPSPNMIWLQNDTISILQDLSPTDKTLLYEQGYSQTMRWWSKRFGQKLL